MPPAPARTAPARLTHRLPQIERPAPQLPYAPQRTAARSHWARLLARIYEVFPPLCPGCGAHGLDPTPAFDPTEPEPGPDFDFDQSRGA